MTAVDVAKYFLAKTSLDDEAFLSHLKLQKLLYYAQGFWLALNAGQPLFNEAVLAWEHGPVVRSVWEKYRDYRGGTPIPPELIDWEGYPEEVRETLDQIWRVYGQFSAWKLREMTHIEPPWSGTLMNAEISRSAMRHFFQGLLLPDAG